MFGRAQGVVKLYRITETVTDQRRSRGEFALEIVVTRRFLRRARRSAKAGDRDAMYRVWYAMCDFAWPRVRDRYGLINSERRTWAIMHYHVRHNVTGVTHHPMSVP